VIWVGLSTVKEPAALLPKVTAVALEKLVPVMVTLVPPDVGPVLGLTLVTVGGPSCARASPPRPTAHRRTAKTAPANGTQARRCITRFCNAIANAPRPTADPLRVPRTHAYADASNKLRECSPRPSAACLVRLEALSPGWSHPPNATTLGNPCVGKRTQRETVLRSRR
jgi:hypothetical protein